MKQIFLLLIALLSFSSLKAQDILMLKSGDELKVKVVEIGLNEVKYKKFDNQGGPTYSVFKSEIFMIKYPNGTKEVFKDGGDAPMGAINEQKVKEIEAQYQKELDEAKRIKGLQADLEKFTVLYKKRLKTGKTLVYTGVGMFGGGVIMSAIGFSLPRQVNYNEKTITPGGLALGISGMIIAVVGIPLGIVGAINWQAATGWKKKMDATKGALSFEPNLGLTPNNAPSYGFTMKMSLPARANAQVQLSRQSKIHFNQ